MRYFISQTGRKISENDVPEIWKKFIVEFDEMGAVSLRLLKQGLITEALANESQRQGKMHNFCAKNNLVDFMECY